MIGNGGEGMASQARYDFIIVGSGTSGGIVAHNLQKAGASCLLIEAGHHFTADTFPENEGDYTAQLFWNGGMDLNDRGTLVFLRGKCVGGGSVVNQALMDRFDDVALRDWKSDSDIDFFTPEAMDPWYTAAENGIHLEEIPEAQRNRNAHVFLKGFSMKNLESAPLRRAQSDCAIDEGNDCIACLGGCHRDSKQSTLVAYIPQAQQAGLELVSEFFVEKIEPTADGVTVHGVKNGQTESLNAAKAVLAGGSLGTNQLMLNSGFKAKLPTLGTRFSTHPQEMCFGIFEEPVDAHKGAFQALKSSDKRFREWGFKFENVFAPPAGAAILAPFEGAELLRFMKRFRYLACMEVAVRDEATGVFKTDNKGKLHIRKNLTDQDNRRRTEGLELIGEMMRFAGAKEVVTTQTSFGLHMNGGCAIGTGPENSVVNERFEVHGFPNLFIADASIFPNAPGVNPALTIMALSYKLCSHLAE